LKIFCWKWKNWVDRLEFACTSGNLGFSRILFHKSIEEKKTWWLIFISSFKFV
jgi:hypothetical protein